MIGKLWTVLAWNTALLLLTSGFVMSVYFLKLALAIVALDMLSPKGARRVADDAPARYTYRYRDTESGWELFKDTYFHRQGQLRRAASSAPASTNQEADKMVLVGKPPYYRILLYSISAG